MDSEAGGCGRKWKKWLKIFIFCLPKRRITLFRYEMIKRWRKRKFWTDFAFSFSSASTSFEINLLIKVHFLAHEINTKWKKWKIWQYFRITLLFSCLMCLNFFSIFVQWYYGIPVYVMYIHNYIYNFITFFLFSSRFLDIFFSARNWNILILFQFRAEKISARNRKTP